MLTKITDNFYLDLNSLLLVDKVGRELRLFIKGGDMSDPMLIGSSTNEGRALIGLLERMNVESV